MSAAVSVVLPAKNEAANLQGLLPELRATLPEAEIVVIDDGSTDGTREVALEHGARCISHPYSMGNGAAVKRGARVARGDILVFMDADGQHRPADVPRLLAALEGGYDMVVGARDAASQASLGRRLANGIYNRLASWMVEHRIEDLTSGFRAVRARRFRQFLYMLPNTFSYPSTITMAFFRAGYLVGYVPIRAERRGGRSHIRPLKDGLRFLLIIFRIGTLYSPMKMFLPISLGFLGLGLGYYAWTFAMQGRFTNMSALLLTTSVLVFLIGMLSEQITTMIFSRVEG